MVKIQNQKLKPCEGIKIRLPNGNVALELLTFRGVSIDTITDNNIVKIIVEFDEPFIKNREDDEIS
jgi:hypothetical protein